MAYACNCFGDAVGLHVHETSVEIARSRGVLLKNLCGPSRGYNAESLAAAINCSLVAMHVVRLASQPPPYIVVSCFPPHRWCTCRVTHLLRRCIGTTLGTLHSNTCARTTMDGSAHTRPRTRQRATLTAASILRASSPQSTPFRVYLGRARIFSDVAMPGVPLTPESTIMQLCQQAQIRSQCRCASHPSSVCAGVLARLMSGPFSAARLGGRAQHAPA